MGSGHSLRGMSTSAKRTVLAFVQGLPNSGSVYLASHQGGFLTKLECHAPRTASSRRPAEWLHQAWHMTPDHSPFVLFANVDKPLQLVVLKEVFCQTFKCCAHVFLVYSPIQRFLRIVGIIWRMMFDK